MKEYNPPKERMPEKMDNDEYGQPEQIHSANLKKAKNIATVLNVIGAISGCWIFFRPEPYKLAASVAILFPFVAASIMRKYRKSLPADLNDNAVQGKLNVAFLGPALGLALSALNHFHVLAHDTVWLPSIVLTILLCVMIMRAESPGAIKNVAGVVSFFLSVIFYLGYGYGTVIAVNCGWDDSDPGTEKKMVVNKRATTGKYRTYHISLRHENQFDGTFELKVPRQLYVAVQKGDDVLLDYRKGLLNASWLNIRSSDGTLSGAPSHR